MTKNLFSSRVVTTMAGVAAIFALTTGAAVLVENLANDSTPEIVIASGDGFGWD